MKNALILLAVLAAIGLYTWVSQGWLPTTEDSAPVPQNTTPAPAFTADTLDGRRISPEDFRGKTIVLNFWATWCAPCVVEFPMMLQLASATSDKSVFIFVSVDEDRAAIDRFLAKYAASLPMDKVHVVWNPDKDIAEKLYGTFQLPETYLIDGNGSIAEKIIGADIDWTSAGMQQKIRRLAVIAP